jgi:hypothetical protein
VEKHLGQIYDDNKAPSSVPGIDEAKLKAEEEAKRKADDEKKRQDAEAEKKR